MIVESLRSLLLIINSACRNFNFIRNIYREFISVYLLWEGGYDTYIYQITCTLWGRGLSRDILFFISPPPHEDGGFLKKEFFISSSIKLKIIGPFRHFFLKVLTNNPLPCTSCRAEGDIMGDHTP